ncbi:TolC family protein [uncultured Deefgea sp.]|uniref:TolC family protein n=1 Tax=uncultured Deefgea sp. TaxID=1304914 RepID=UPI002591964B|nr:TolC family protein [uncultured Deefgea sp.]
MQSKRFYAPILWCTLIALPAHAATIKEAFALASQIDAPVQTAQQRKALSALRHAQSITPEPLSLTLSGSNSLDDNLSPSQGSREYEAELGIPLWQWGQKDRLLAQVNQLTKLEQSQWMLSHWALAGALREAVWSARLAKLAQDSAQQKLLALEKIHHDLQRQLQAGEVAPLDVNLAHQAWLEAQLQVALSAQQLNDSLQQFQALAGDIPLPDQPETRPLALETMVHPQRQVLQAQTELALAQLAQAQYDTRDTPELALSLTRERGAPDEDYKNRGKISMRIPFGAEGRTQARVTSANSELISAQTQVQRTERQISTQQQMAHHALTLANQQLQMAQQRLQLATQAWQWQQRSYRAGQTSLTAFLTAQSDFLERGFAVQRAELELGRADSRYLQTLGVLP